MTVTHVTSAAFEAFARKSHPWARSRFQPAQRSSLYEDWLRTQPAAYRVQLWAAEKEFTREHAARLESFERVLQDLMEGYEDTPAGRAKAFNLDKDDGDWSWKPAQDKVLGKNFRTFHGVLPSAAELYRGTYHQAG